MVLQKNFEDERLEMTSTGVNGISYLLKDRAGGLANYPHARKVNGMIYVSGISSRRPDNTWEG
jgi:2-aminomuconate deaminase